MIMTVTLSKFGAIFPSTAVYRLETMRVQSSTAAGWLQPDRPPNAPNYTYARLTLTSH